MKKRVKFLFMFFMLIFSMAIINSITGDTVTGEVTESDLALTISLLGPPSLTIISPENKTYLDNESLSVNYIAVGEETVWYNFDNTPNTTITSSFIFNISQGTHTLYLYANNSEGNTTKNVTFTANSTKFLILYSEFAGSTKGESIDFNSSNYEDIQNLSGIILENTDYGKIEFNEAINLTDDVDISDNQVDLNSNINVSDNFIEINSTALPNLNKSATLYLYDLTFSSSRIIILKDGEECPSSICTKESYSGGILKFNVTQFTSYSADETSLDDEPRPGPGGGGGSLAFNVSIDEIEISLKQGEIKTEEITIKNKRNTKLSFSLFSDMGELVKISDESFELGPKEEKTISIDFIARADTVPELYLGNLFIESGGLKREIPITMEVESRGALFDVKLNIPEKYLQIYLGEELISEIEIFNIFETGKVNVTIEYLIKDQQNREIISEEEILSVDRGAISFVKKFEIPENIEPGRYILYVRVTYDGKVASASAWFYINKGYLRILQIILIVLIIITTFIILFIIIRRRKGEKNKRRGKKSKMEMSKSHKLGSRGFNRKVSGILEREGLK